MISDEECALWHLAVAKPPVAGALDVYLDWLLTHDTPRGQRLAIRMQNPTERGGDDDAEKLWRKALGLPPNHDSTSGMFFDPLPYFVYLRAHELGALEPVVDRLPFLEIHLDFGCPDDAAAARMVAQPAFAKIRRLHWSAYGDSPSDENYQSMDRHYHGNEVFRALCASPNLVDLEELSVTESFMDPELCVPALVAAKFRNLRKLEFGFIRFGNEGVIQFAASPAAASLRHLELSGHGIEDSGAIAIATHLRSLEVLDVRHNPIGPAGEAALRALPALRELLISPAK